MEKLSKIGKYEFLAEPFHCDFSSHLFMGHLGNHLLNAADFHSNERGYGMNYLNTVRKTWVLSRLAVEMDDMPGTYDRFSVETWVDDVMRFFTSRNFRITGQDGHVYGYGKSIWAMIDVETRQPADVLSVRGGLIKDYIEKEYPCPIAQPSRVKMSGEASPVRMTDTCYSDVDVNGHVNSVKYIEHILDLWNLDWYRKHPVRRFEIAYVAESHQGDRLHFYCERRETDVDFNVRIAKEGPDCGETEVCRCRVLFA
ncbi:acyl-[acyl-carrier-protein] thioesterase [Prevotella multiformis]|uniref:acyl-[acyl-carrier-protein] thioesterase n=1 Tax=Prevotella multiformis TaxID=282402 RepID=UPI0023F117A4|nr:acyl-ACP thioesterase domain-containing protein [Prevotella multiformis]